MFYFESAMTLALLVAIGLNFSVAMGQSPEEVEFPALQVPAYEGERYEAMVPDTLDLNERMKYSLHAFTHTVVCLTEDRGFPSMRYPAQHFINITKGPMPKLVRAVRLYGKFMLGSALARAATGVEQDMQVDEDWRQAWMQVAALNPVMMGPEGGRQLSWIAANYAREKDERWLKLGQRAVARLKEVAIPHGETVWIHGGLHPSPPDEGWPSREAAKVGFDGSAEALSKPDLEPPHGWDASWMTWTVEGLCDFYQVSGDKEALELARMLAYYLKDEGGLVGEDGRLLAGHECHKPVIHFHHSIQGAHAVLAYGVVSGDGDCLEFADKAYQEVLRMGNRTTGFTPEYAYMQYPREQTVDDCEACNVADAIMLALRLSDAGVADYYDDVDRYMRNQLATLQITNTRRFYDTKRYREQGWGYPNADLEAAYSPLVGNFGGWSTPNDWNRPEFGIGIMTCCVGNSTRAMYYIADRIVQFAEGELRVNFMLSHASPWADVSSYRPYEGQLEIVVKQDAQRVLVRAPEWVQTGSKEVSSRVNGQTREPFWEGRYLLLGAAKAGERIEVTFPISVRTVQEEIGGQAFTLTIKGSTVVGIDPPGEYMPLYQRSRYLADEAPMVRVNRYVGPRMELSLTSPKATEARAKE
jgi:hypothetical protein